MHSDAPSIFREGGMISIQKKNLINKYILLLKKLWIGQLGNWCHEQDSSVELTWIPNHTEFFDDYPKIGNPGNLSNNYLPQGWIDFSLF